jgi:HSP20 family molecular chaperone IbpA
MKERFMFDMGQVFDEVFETAQKFKDAFADGFPRFNCAGTGAKTGFQWDENVDFYPFYPYPPANVYLTKDRELILEFAFAGFEEKDINLQFQGDYLVLSAKPSTTEAEEGVRYFKRRLKYKEIVSQKYHAPESKFDRDKVKAVFRNGVLKVTIPPKEGYTTSEGVKIDIVKEGN